MSEERAQEQPLHKLPDLINVLLTHDELYSLSQLMQFCTSEFNKLTADALVKGDPKEEELNRARAHISLVLHNRLKAFAKIGEPESKQVH